MSGLYVYAIVDRPEIALPALRGFDDAALGGVRVGDLMAVVSPLSAGEVPLSRANLLCHERVIEALMRTHAVLPTRFGTTAEREERLRERLEANAAGFSATLDRVRGRVEIALRVGWQPSDPAPASRPHAADSPDGRSYMQALLEQRRHSQRQRAAAEELAAEISAGLADLADATSEQVLPTPELLLKAAYLVQRERLPELRRRVDALRVGRPELTILATGPWPAYSFVEERGLA